MGKLIFDCGCEFLIHGTDDEIHANFHEGQLPLGIDVDIYNLPHTCSRTWALLAEGRSKGVFQLEGHLGKTWAAKIQPENMEELGALISLIRPGCLRAKTLSTISFHGDTVLDIKDSSGVSKKMMVLANEKHEIKEHRKVRKSPKVKLEFPEGSPFAGTTTVDENSCVISPAKSMTEHYKDRKHRLEDIEYLHPSLEPILSSTYAVLVYQESSMQIAVTLGGFSLQQADILRKAIGKKKADVMAKVEKEFLDGCSATGIVSKEEAEEIFGWVRESQKYSFNKSHAISYGEGSYWTAYLKAHFPVQFYCSYLHGAQWKQDVGEEVYEIVNDAKLTGVEICTPDFRDQREIPYVRDNHVFFGLGDIKQIGKAALIKVKTKAAEATELAGEDIGGWSWLDYLMQFSSEVPSTVNEAMISCGGLDYLQKSRSSMLYELSIWSKITKKEKEWIKDIHNSCPFPNLLSALHSCGKTKKEGGGCHGAKRVKIVVDLCTILEKPPYSLHDTSDFIAWSEEKYLGAPLTCSKVDGCEKAVEANAVCRDVILGAHTGYTVLAVEITRVKEIKTKRGKTPGQRMAFISASDSSCCLDDIIAFPETWREYSGLIHEGNTVLMQGEKSTKKGSSFIIKKIWQI